MTEPKKDPKTPFLDQKLASFKVQTLKTKKNGGVGGRPPDRSTVLAAARAGGARGGPPFPTCKVFLFSTEGVSLIYQLARSSLFIGMEGSLRKFKPCEKAYLSEAYISERTVTLQTFSRWQAVHVSCVLDSYLKVRVRSDCGESVRCPSGTPQLQRLWPRRVENEKRADFCKFC